MRNKGLMCFSDASMQSIYEKKGFVVAPFLSKKDIEQLEAIFYRHFNIDELPTVHDTVATTPAEIIKAVDDEILQVCLPLIEKQIKNYHWVCSIYFVKKSAEESYKGMHLDTSMTVEGFNNLGIWIPLCDIDETNGQICFLSGSEKFLPPYSTPSMPYAYQNVEQQAEQRITCLNINAGDALFFNNNMLHCTQKNSSGKTRLAVIIKLIDKNAPLATVYYNPDSELGKQVALYEHEKDFFVKAEFRKPTPPETSKFLGYIQALPHIFSVEEFSKKVNELESDKN